MNLYSVDEITIDNTDEIKLYNTYEKTYTTPAETLSL